MNVTIAIEELVINGIPLSPSERPLLARAVHRELARLVARGGSENLATEPRQNLVAAQPCVVTSPVSAHALGQQVAQAIYGALQK